MSGGWVIYTTHQDRKRKIHLNAPNETDQKLCATTEQVRPYATLEPYLCRSDKWGAVLDMIDGWKLSQSIWRYETVGIVWDDGNTYPRGSGRHAEGPLLAYFERCFQAAASCPARYSVHECVQMELYRMDVMRTLRREFFSMLDTRRITRPREAFNRWLFEARTFLDTSKSTGVKVKCLVPDEPLIPTIDPTQHNSPSLERELLKACRDRSRQVDEALGKLYTEQVIETLTRRAIEEAKRLSDMRQKLSVCLLAFSPVHVLSSNTKVVLRFEGILHEILPGHYKKFEILYRNAGRDLSRGFQSVESTSSTLVNKSQDQKNEVPLDCPTLRNESAWMDEFHYRLFVLLQRYENATGSRAGVGSGHHAATPPDILDVLHRHMGVVLECFASPINCHFPHYCSAFVDTDVFFGSIGSFFDFYPVEGSFEAGPPYVEELMDAMYTHICSLLSASQRPLSFCLVIPEWKTTPTSVILRIDANAEGFVRRVIVVPRGQHVYADGFQHCLRNTYFRPVHNTLIVVMQNEAGAKKWPCTDALEVEMLTVWKTLAECVAENPLFLVKEDQASLRGSQALGSERDPNAEVYQKRHRETTGDSKRELSPTQHLPLQDQ